MLETLHKTQVSSTGPTLLTFSSSGKLYTTGDLSGKTPLLSDWPLVLFCLIATGLSGTRCFNEKI